MIQVGQQLEGRQGLRCGNGREIQRSSCTKRFAILTVFEFLASLIRLSADLTSSRTASVSEFFREFRWSCTFTQTLSIICDDGRQQGLFQRCVNLRERIRVAIGVCTHLLCGGGHDALLESVRLFLQVFPGFMIPEQIVLNLVG